MLTNVDKKMPTNIDIFSCEYCDFVCYKYSNFIKHQMTQKHQNIDKMLTTNGEKKTVNENKKFECDCGKSYKHRQSLSVHKKKCKNFNNDEMVKYLMKENSEMKHMIIDVCKNIGTIQNNNCFNNTNSNNKTFNLQFFLNETCKDAMNIMEFVDSVKLQLTDLEKVGELGYVNGISNIIVKKLNALDVGKRPVHCTDSKRDVLYIKDDNKWEKENETNNRLRKVIKKVADKNVRLIPEFKDKYPDCIKAYSKFTDQYNKIIIESMGGPGNNEMEKEDKIIHKIAKEVVIDKTKY